MDAARFIGKRFKILYSFSQPEDIGSIAICVDAKPLKNPKPITAYTIILAGKGGLHNYGWWPDVQDCWIELLDVIEDPIEDTRAYLAAVAGE